MKSMMGSLAFSQGVPMVSHGDEIGRTQKGNNNAYAQDNELTWVDWHLDARQTRAPRIHPSSLCPSRGESRCCAGATSSTVMNRRRRRGRT